MAKKDHVIIVVPPGMNTSPALFNLNGSNRLTKEEAEHWANKHSEIFPESIYLICKLTKKAALPTITPNLEN